MASLRKVRNLPSKRWAIDDEVEIQTVINTVPHGAYLRCRHCRQDKHDEVPDRICFHEKNGTFVSLCHIIFQKVNLSTFQGLTRL